MESANNIIQPTKKFKLNVERSMPSKENTESKNAPKPSPAAVVENGIVTSPEPKAMETPEEIIKKYTIASAVAGVVPVPIFDLAATSGIIMKMVADLAKAHGESFSKSKATHIVGSLVASLGFLPLGIGIFGSLFKVIPGIGSVVGMAATPIVAGGVTYATGQVFLDHFKSGGSLLSFTPEKAKGFFKEEFKKGKAFAKDATSSGS
ncbi:DUF697 domain-containing protein [Akkermansiaceae bacterium]|nr:DUF697 domain-containing protein [Akkermansiaceae bacterium]MDB4518014.1 DUF697 domain-containing protein [Akkermansiaceae bacterium]